MRPRRLAFLAPLALFALACGSSSSPSPDAGSDAGSHDGGGDAGNPSDAGHSNDAGNANDAGNSSDGGGDAGQGSLDAGPLFGDAGTSWAFLFGGHFEVSSNDDPPGDYYGDFWSWSGTAWTRLDAGGPGQRSMAAAAPFRDGLMMYGGEGGNPDFNQTTLSDGWFWSGSAWREFALDTANGAPEPAALVTGLSCGGNFVVYGGYDLTGSNRYDTWVFDGAWTHFPAPGQNLEPVDGGPQSAFGVAAASVNGTCYLIDSLGSMFSWNGSAWSAVDQGATTPPARSFASAAGLGNTLVLFGGADALDGGTLGDTWIWDGAQWRQSLASGPPPRSGAAMAPYGSTALLFGGVAPVGDGDEQSAAAFLGDTWSWDGASWTQVADGGPSPRADATMAGQ